MKHTPTLTRAQALAFKALAPAALCLVATDGPVSMTLYGRSGAVVERIVHNRGVWQAKVARSASWKDTVTTTHEKSPFHVFSVQFRTWCLTDAERDRLAEGVVELIARRAESDGGIATLRHGAQDLGPDLDLALFELEVVDIARRLKVPVWDDAGLLALLDAAHARAERWRTDSRAGRSLDQLIERAVMQEVGR